LGNDIPHGFYLGFLGDEDEAAERWWLGRETARRNKGRLDEAARHEVLLPTPTQLVYTDAGIK